MSTEMAQLILRKKVDALRGKLLARRVELVLSPEAESHLLNLGYTPEYGAREIERIVARETQTAAHSLVALWRFEAWWGGKGGGGSR